MDRTSAALLPPHPSVIQNSCSEGERDLPESRPAPLLATFFFFFFCSKCWTVEFAGYSEKTISSRLPPPLPTTPPGPPRKSACNFPSLTGALTGKAGGQGVPSVHKAGPHLSSSSHPGLERRGGEVPVSALSLPTREPTSAPNWRGDLGQAG